MINYNINDYGTLCIYNDNAILAEISDVSPDISDKNLEKLVEDVLYGLGYKWLNNGEIKLLEKQSDKVEYKNGETKNLNNRDTLFKRRWAALWCFLANEFGIKDIKSVQEESSVSFKVTFMDNTIKTYRVLHSKSKCKNAGPFVQISGCYIYYVTKG